MLILEWPPKSLTWHGTPYIMFPPFTYFLGNCTPKFILIVKYAYHGVYLLNIQSVIQLHYLFNFSFLSIFMEFTLQDTDFECFWRSLLHRNLTKAFLKTIVQRTLTNTSNINILESRPYLKPWLNEEEEGGVLKEPSIARLFLEVCIHSIVQVRFWDSTKIFQA